MGSQVYFEDVQEGTEVTMLRKDPTTQQLVKYAGASGDYYQIHYDQNYAKNNGLPDVILHGALKGAWLGAADDGLDWRGRHAEVADYAVSGHGCAGDADVRQGRGYEEVHRGRREPWSIATSGWKTMRARRRRRARRRQRCLRANSCLYARAAPLRGYILSNLNRQDGQDMMLGALHPVSPVYFA